MLVMKACEPLEVRDLVQTGENRKPAGRGGHARGNGTRGRVGAAYCANPLPGSQQGVSLIHTLVLMAQFGAIPLFRGRRVWPDSHAELTPERAFAPALPGSKGVSPIHTLGESSRPPEATTPARGRGVVGHTKGRSRQCASVGPLDGGRMSENGRPCAHATSSL